MKGDVIILDVPQMMNALVRQINVHEFVMEKSKKFVNFVVLWKVVTKAKNAWKMELARK